ncbi:MAG: hypothetical protein ACRD12_15220 [Acidimicrobiales bacterium]
MTLGRGRRFLLVTMVAAIVLAGEAGTAVALDPTVRVWPVSQPFNGMTYGQWSASWWKWALETPTPVNPLVDPTGANCAVNQPAKVWFLAGSFPGTPTVRHCTVRYDRYLFFPVLNTAFIGTEPHETEAFVHASAKARIDAVDTSTLFARVDGTPVPNLASYRAHSPTFSLTLGPDNVLGAPPGVYGPAAADGFYLLLLPLRPGSHTIRFGGRFPDGGTVDVTYHLNVTL